MLLLTFWYCLLMLGEVRAYIIGNLLYNPSHEQCPNEDAPVCATNDGGVSYLLFPNQCFLEETNKETYLGRTNFKKIPLGFCLKDCNLNCDATYNPICAVDSNSDTKRTFHNKCEMIRDACLTNMDWLHFQMGKCPSDLKEEPPSSTEKKIKRLTPIKAKKAIPCPKVFNPVCAILSGVKSTYINECLVNAENIKTGNDWQIFSEGVCAEDYSNRPFPAIKDKSIVSARSYDPNAFEFPNFEAEFDDDVNYIYAPTIFQTEYINDDGSAIKYPGSNYYSTNSEDANNAFQYAPESPVALSLTENYELIKPIRFPEENDAKVTECKYGHENICGDFNGKTLSFGNICELMMRNIFLKQNWTILHKGECDKCSFNCSKEYNPLCVSRNGVNFTIANECYFNSSMCQDDSSEWKLVSNGECQNPSNNIVEDQYESVTPGFRFTSSYDKYATQSPIISNNSLSTTTSRPSSENDTSSTIASTTQSHYDDVKETTLTSTYSSSTLPTTSMVTSTTPDYTSANDNLYGPSLYGPHRNSFIMRLVEKKAVPAMKTSSYAY